MDRQRDDGHDRAPSRRSVPAWWHGSPLGGRRFLTSAVLVLLLPGAARAQRPVTRPPDLDTVVQRELRAASGAVLALVTGDSVVVRAYGTLDRESHTAMRGDLVFGTVGFQDVLTALVAVVLAEQGTIDLDAPIRRYAPDLPRRVGGITLAQLLSHTGGLDDARDEAPRRGPGPKVWPGATDRALFTEPGAIHSLSRYDYLLVRNILEARTGRSIQQLITDLVLTPAGMERTTFDPARAGQLGAVPGYAVSTTGERPVVPLMPTENPTAQLYAPAGDLGRLVAIWLTQPGEPRDASLAAAFATLARGQAALPESPGDSVGFGVRIDRFLGYRQVSYSGGLAGYGIAIRLIPRLRVGIVVLANGTGEIMRRTADLTLGTLIRQVARRIKLPLPDTSQAAPAAAGLDLPSDPAAYAGTYLNGDRMVALEVRAGRLVWVDADLALAVRRTGSRLEAVIPDGRVAQVFYWTRDAAGEAYVVVAGRAYRRVSRVR